MLKKSLLMLIVISSLNLKAASPYWIGFGNLTHNFLSAQNDEKGGKTVFEAGPVFFIGSSFPFIFSNLSLSPAVGYAKFFTKDQTNRSEIILQYHLSQNLFSSFKLRYGLSNYITKIGGKGGNLELNNGNSTATFYVPSESKTTFTASLDLGTELIFSSQYTLRLQASVLRFLSSERRRISHMLTFNYFF